MYEVHSKYFYWINDQLKKNKNLHELINSKSH